VQSEVELAPICRAKHDSSFVAPVLFVGAALQFEALAFQALVGALQIVVQFGEALLGLGQACDERHHHADGEK